MRHFGAWLEKEASRREMFLLVPGFFLIQAVYTIFIFILLRLLGVSFAGEEEGTITILTLTFPFVLFLLASIEELLFRFIPLALTTELFSGRGLSFALPVVIVASSVVFGYIHGEWYNVLIQGGGGVLWCILFLKAGGLQRRYDKALLTTSFSHFAWNGAIVLLVLASGGTKI